MKKSKMLKIFSYLVMLMAFVFVGSVLCGNAASATTVYYDANKIRYKQVSDLQEAITSCEESKLKYLSYSSSYCVIYMEEDYDDTSAQLEISSNTILYTEGYNIYTSIAVGNSSSLIISNTSNKISKIGNYNFISGTDYSNYTIVLEHASKLEVRGKVISDNNLYYYTSDYLGGNIYTTTNIIIFSGNSYSPISLCDISIAHIYDATIMDKAPDGTGYVDHDIGLFNVSASNTAPLLVIRSGEMFFSSEYLVTGDSLINIEINGIGQARENSSLADDGENQMLYPYLYVENFHDFQGIIGTDSQNATSFFGSFSMIAPEQLASYSGICDSYGNSIEEMGYEGIVAGSRAYYSTYLPGYKPDDVYEIQSDGEYVYRADVSSCITISGVSGNVIILDFAGHDIACGDDTNVITINETYVEKLIIMNANIFLRTDSSQNVFHFENVNCEIVFFNVSLFALGRLEQNNFSFSFISGNSLEFDDSTIILANINDYGTYDYTSEFIENYKNSDPELNSFQNYFFVSEIRLPQSYVAIESSAIVANVFDSLPSGTYINNSYVSSVADGNSCASIIVENIENSEMYGCVDTSSISNSFIQCNSATCEAISASSSTVRISNSIIRTKGTIVGANTNIQIEDDNTFLYGENVFSSTTTSKIIPGLVGYIVYDDTTDATHSHKVYLKASEKNIILTINGNSTDHDTISEALASASSTDSIKIALIKNITECVTISTTIKNIEFDLNGKTWTCNDGVALNVSGGTSNTSAIVIDDFASNLGTITASNSYTIKLEFSGIFSLYKGQIINTGSSGTIFATTYANIINIGNSDSTTTNLQVLNTGSGSSIVIDDLGAPSIILNVNRGLIVGKTWTIFSNSASSTINIGNDTSKINNLKIISTNTSSGYYGVQAKTGAIFNFKGGFIGSAAGESQAYNSAPTVSNGTASSSTTTYDGTTYNGKMVAVAHINSTYYETIDNALNALTSTSSSTILVLDANIEGFSISSAKQGIIDLNGKTIKGSVTINDYSSNITITDYSNSVGTITSSGYAINLYGGTLIILKGIITSTSGSAININTSNLTTSTLTIGDSSSNVNNLQIISKYRAIYGNYGKTVININNGLIVGGSSNNSIDIAKNTIELNIGTDYSTKDTLQVISTSTLSGYYAVNKISGVTFNFINGFIGSAYSKGYSFNTTPTLQKGYTLSDATITYDGKTINGYEIVVKIVAHINSTYYSSLQDAVDALNSTTSNTIVLDDDVAESVTISSTKIGIIDLNGKKWTANGDAALLFNGGSSNKSNITITDTSSSVGVVTSTSDTIKLNFTGTLNILKGIIKTTNTGYNSAAIWNNGSATIKIGDDSSNISNLQILNTAGGYAIYSAPVSTININNGLIVGKTYGIYSTSSSSIVNIGSSYSTKDTLQVISLSTSSSYYGIYVGSSVTFNFVNGFVGKAYSRAQSYNVTPNLLTDYLLSDDSVTYSGTTISGYRVALAPVAFIGSTYYSTLTEGISALTSTTKTLTLYRNVTECVSVTATIIGTIDLNGKTWSSCSNGRALNLNKFNNASNLTITDNTSNVGTISSAYSDTIAHRDGTLTILKGIIQTVGSSNNPVTIWAPESASTIVVGNSNSTIDNLKILNLSGGASGPAIQTGGKLTINNGLIVGNYNTINSENTSVVITVGANYSTANSLRIIATSTSTSYWGLLAQGTFNFNGGFIGSRAGSSYAYNKTPSIPSNTRVDQATISYNGTSYTGKILASGVAHIGLIYYSSLQEAIDALNSTSSTIVLDTNISECISISSSIVRTIDLNGKTWSCTGNAALNITSSATITITGTGTVTSNKETIKATAGIIDIYKGTFTSTSTTTTDYVFNISNARLNIGNDTSTTSNLQIISSSVGGGIYGASAIITIYNGRIYSSNYKTIRVESGNLTVYKGIIKTDAKNDSHDAIFVNPATLNIGDGKSTTNNLQISAMNGAALYIAKASSTYIYGGKMYSSNGKAIVATDTSSITLERGYIQTASSDSGDDAIWLKVSASLRASSYYEDDYLLSNITVLANAGRAIYMESGARVTLNYGLFASSANDAIFIKEESTGWLKVGSVLYSTKDNLQILALSTAENMYGVYKQAGTFNFYAGFIGAGYGYDKAYNSVSTYTGKLVTSLTVTYGGKAYKGITPAVATIGSTYYASMYQALMATEGASSPKTIVLYASFTESVSISDDINAIINLNNKTWTGESSSGFTLMLGYTANVQITDSTTSGSVGTIKANYSTAAAIILNEYAELTVLKGKFEGKNAIRAGGNSKLTIGSGTNDYSYLQVLSTYTSAGDYGYAVFLRGNATFTYKSGFLGSDAGSSSNYSYAYNTGVSGVTYSITPTTSIVNSSYSYFYGKSLATVCRVNSSNSCYLYYDKLQTAVNSAPTSAVTIKLLFNISEEVTIEETNKNITIDLNGKTWSINNRALTISNASSVTITDTTSSVGTISAKWESTILISGNNSTLTLKKGIIQGASDNSAIYIASGISTNLTVGVFGTSTVSNLKVLSYSTSDFAINFGTGGTNFNFNGGFIASRSGNAYSGTAIPPEGDYAVGQASYYYGGYTYTGKAIKGVAATVGDTKYASIKEALAASGSTIKLYANVSECVTVSSAITKTIDLNGKTWSCSGTALSITAKATITITDNSTGNVGTMTSTVQTIDIAANANASVLLYKGIFKATSTNVENEVIQAYAGAKVTIGNSSSTTSNLQILSPSGGAAIYSRNATVTINNGLIQADNKTAVDCSGGTLNIYKGIIKSTSSSSDAYAISAHPATITIGNSSSTTSNLQILSNEGYAIRLQNSTTTARINAGVIFARNWHGVYLNDGSSVVIGDVSYSTSNNLQILAGSVSYYGLYLSGSSSATVTAKVNAGFLGSPSSSGANAYKAANSYSTITINGIEVSENHKYNHTTYGEATYYGKGIYAVEKGNQNYYNSLSKAIASSTASKGSPDDLKIQAEELIECVTISSTKYLNIDLNGNTWKCESNSQNLYLSGNSNNTSEITITDNSGSIGNMQSTRYVFNLQFAGKLNIYKGNYTSTSNYVVYDYNGAHTFTIGDTSMGSSTSNLRLISNSSSAIYNYSASNTSIIINAGLIRSESTYAIKNSIGKITINGGSIFSNKSHAIYVSGSSSTVIVNSGDITAKGAGIYATSSAKVTINGGSILGRDDELSTITYAVYAASSASLTITGGNFTANRVDNSLYMTGAKATITGGSFSEGILAESNSTLEISGGYISSYSTTAIKVDSSTLKIYKGTISSSSSINGNRAIYAINSTVTIGDSNSTISNLKIFRENTGVAVWVSGGTTTITRGLIYSSTDHGVHIDASGKVIVGDSTSNGGNLQIFSEASNSGYYGVSAGDGATLTYNSGFLGSAYSNVNAYYKNATNATINVGSPMYTSAIVYEGSIIFGKIISSYRVATVNNYYYDVLSNATDYWQKISASTSKTLKLLDNAEGCITISSTTNGTIDLNGKTWTCSGSTALTISGSTNNSNITITDTSGGIGSISGLSRAIYLNFKGTLKIYKASIKRSTSVSSGNTIYIYGNYGGSLILGESSSSSATNVRVEGVNVSGSRAIYVNNTSSSTSTYLTINSATITGYTGIRTYGNVNTSIHKITVIATANAVEFSNGGSSNVNPTVVLGDGDATSSNLQLLSTGTTGKGLVISGYSTSSKANLTIYGGFISNSYTISNCNTTLYGKEISTTLSITGTNFSGIKFVVAEIDSTQYETLKSAFSSITGSDKIVKLLSNRNENVTISSKTFTIDLQGYTWSSSNITLNLNSSYITITDTSSSIGTITSLSNYVIFASGGRVSILKGNFIASSTAYAIQLNNKAKLETNTNSNSDDTIRIISNGAAIYASSSTVYINGGYIKSTASHGIYLSNSDGIINRGTIIGSSTYGAIYSNLSSSSANSSLQLGETGVSGGTINNLKIVNNTTSGYGVYVKGFSSSYKNNFTIYGGFMGSVSGTNYAYYASNTNTTMFGSLISMNSKVDETTYSGKGLVVSEIEDSNGNIQYCLTLQECFDKLPTSEPSTYPILRLLGDRSERVTFSTTRYGIVDLNGKTWSAGSNMDVLYITGGNSNVSNITFTDYSSSVGGINGSYNAIVASFAGNLKLYKGIFNSSQYTISIGGKATLTIGDSSSTLDNLKILSTTTTYSTIDVVAQNSAEKPTLIINNGTIYLPVAEGSSSSTISLENTNAYIYKGTIRGNGDSVLNVKDGVTLVIGNSSSTTTNLVIMGGTSSTKGLVIKGTESNKDDVTINGGYISANYAIWASYASLNVIGGSISGGAGAGISGSSNVSIVIGQNNRGGSGPTISSSATITASYVTIYNGTIKSSVIATDELTIYGGTITGSVVVDGAKLTMYAGTIIGYITHGSSSYSPTITIGVVNDEYYSSADRLKIINTNSNSFAITMTRGTFIFNRGFIGAASGSDYAYSLGSNVSTIIDNVFNSSDTYNSTTYGGKAIAVAHIGSTKYKTLSEAFDALNNTTTKTIVLDGNVDEKKSIYSSAKGIIDLNGHIWTYSDRGYGYSPTFTIGVSGTTFNPDITITDSSSDASGIIKNYSNNSSISFESGKLIIIKGTIKGLVLYGNGTLVVGDSTSTSNNLHILSDRSSNAISLNSGVSFTYNGGFIGSNTSNNYSYTYQKNVSGTTYTINGLETNTAITYDGTTYYGTKLYVAHNETTSTYYETLKDAFNDLSDTKTTKLWLDGNRNERVELNKQVLVEIDLRGYTWSGASYDSAISFSPNTNAISTVTITDTSSSIGKIIGGYTYAIEAYNTNLNIYKGIITSTVQGPPCIFVSGNSNVNIGNSESTEENLKIYGSAYAIYLGGNTSTFTMNGGLISAINQGIRIDSYVDSYVNLTIYRGTIMGKYGIYANNSGFKAVIGDSKSNPDNLKIVSTSTSEYAINLSSSSTNPSSLVINSGFIGSLDSNYEHTYNVDSNTIVTINGEKINSTTTIDPNTYYGFFVAVAHIGDTYYTSLQDAFDALDDKNGPEITIVLDGNPNECVSFSTTKIGTLDLNGKTWSCTNGNALLDISGGSANKSNITITDNSGSVGSMIAIAENIRAKFGGSLNIYKGNLKAQYCVISAGEGVTISLGNSDTKDSDLTLSNTSSVPAIYLINSTLYMSNGTVINPPAYSSSAGIYANASSVTISKGIINSGSYAINAKNNSYIYLGNGYSNVNNLKVISSSTSYSTINLENSTFTYNGGFISTKVAAYNKDTAGVTYKINGIEINTSTSYNDTIYSGITLAAASIGDTYYEYLQDAFDALTSSSTDTIIKLEKSLAENITAISKAGIVDLNGKSWYSLSSVPGATILTLNSSSSITITSSGSNEYGGEIINNYGNSILVDETSSLKVLKGKIQGEYAGISSGGNVVIGDREETSNNIRIIGGDDFYAIYTAGGTLVVNGGVITSTRLSAIYSVNTKININRGIIYSLKESGVFASSGTTLVVGNMESTVNNLLILSGSVYGVSLSGISSNKTSFTFVGGFIGSGNGYDYAYETDAANVTYTINGAAINTTASYDGLSYPGKTPAVAHIGYTYYNSLEKAFNELNESTTVDTTIVLDSDVYSLTIQDIETNKSYTISACVTISTTKIGTIDLNGKTWGCFDENLFISGESANKSNLTITDNSDNLGVMVSYDSSPIYINGNITLNIYKGKIYSDESGPSGIKVEFESSINIGNEKSTIDNLIIYGNYAIFSIASGTININNGHLYGHSAGISLGSRLSVLNVYKGKINGTYSYGIGSSGTVIIGDFSGSSQQSVQIEGGIGGIYSSSTLMIKSGRIVGKTGIKLNGATLTVYGGTITGSASTAISAEENSNVRIDGGLTQSETTYAIQVTNSSYSMNGGVVTGVNGIQLNESSDAVIHGGTIIGNGTSGVGIYAIGDGYIEVTDAMITGTEYGILFSGVNNEKIVINSGSVTGNVGIQVEDIYAIDIYGGTITGTGSYAVNMISGTLLNYEDGTLIGSRNNNYSYYYGENVKLDIEYEEYTIINNDNMYETNLVKESVASLSNGSSYYKLSEAIENAQVGDTITILKDITPSQIYNETIYYTVNLNKQLIIDLNGKTINNYLYSMNANTNLFIDISSDIKIVGTGNIVSYSSILKNVIRVDSGALTLGDINDEYSEDLVITSNFGYAVTVLSNTGTFIYNSGKLVVNSSDSTYSNIYSNAGRFVTRDGYHVEMSHVNNVHTAKLVKGSIINDDNQLEIIYKEVSGKLHIIVKSNKEDRTGKENISVDIAKRVKDSTSYSFEYANNSCEITNKQCETILENEEIAYLYNVTYANELVVRYVNTDSEGFVIAEESIQKDLTISPEAGDSTSIYKGENDIISDGDILLLNVKDVSTINSNMKNNREAIYDAIFGKHWSNVIKTISDPGDVSVCSISSSSICTNLTSLTFTATYNSSAPQPANGIVFKKLVVYNYAPRLNENATVTQNVVCEYGSSCEASELVFMDYKGNKVENVENVITLNGEVVDSIDTTKLGNYVVTTYAIDDYGYRSNNIVRTYTVVDNEAPIIEASDEIIYVEKGHGLKDIDVKAYDNHDEDVTVEIITSNINFNKKGTYEVVYKATDSSGNTTLIYRTVVVKNTTEVVLYSIIGVLTLIILVMGFILLRRKRRLNV